MFMLGMVKNGFGQSGIWTRKLTVSLKDEQMELTDFLLAGTNSSKLKSDGNFLNERSQKWVQPVW